LEFGAKVGIAVTAPGNLIAGARAYAGAPFDGHTLHEQVETATILMQDTGEKPSTAVVDLGYRGVGRDNPELIWEIQRHLAESFLRISPARAHEMA
jgi:IS5 family transposase